MKRCILMHPSDEVATAMENIAKGEMAEIYDTDNCFVREQLALEDIPFGNKIALVPKIRQCDWGNNRRNQAGGTGACT